MGNHYTKEDILRLVEEEDVEFIRLQFVDMFGNLKNLAITVNQLDKALDNMCDFDGAAIDGFTNVEEADMYLHPDFDTFTIFPWRPQQGKVARFICDVYGPDKKPFEGDPRIILKNSIEKAKKMGYSLTARPEIEFFLFQSDENGQPTTQTHESAGFFDMGPNDFGENARRDIILTLEDMGFDVEASHHEIAPAQHEIDFSYGNALETADNISTFKLTVRTIAKKHGMHATFMPKPRYDYNGSGMHLNMALFDENDKNVFEDENDPNGLSETAYYFIGGLMKHISALTAIVNPLVNSYKRLVPGFEAPVYVAWSGKSRSSLIRIPRATGRATRIELRSPDPATNPYLMLAACLEAGLDGIANKIMPPAAVDANIELMSEAQKDELGIVSLPGTLIEAISALEADAVVKDALGQVTADKYIEAKKAEWNTYRTQITNWEINEYLNRY